MIAPALTPPQPEVVVARPAIFYAPNRMTPNKRHCRTVGFRARATILGRTSENLAVITLMNFVEFFVLASAVCFLFEQTSQPPLWLLQRWRRMYGVARTRPATQQRI